MNASLKTVQNIISTWQAFLLMHSRSSSARFVRQFFQLLKEDKLQEAGQKAQEYCMYAPPGYRDLLLDSQAIWQSTQEADPDKFREQLLKLYEQKMA